MKILYFTRSDSVHDQRFLTTLAKSGYEGYCLRLNRGEFPTPDGIKVLPWKGIDGLLHWSQIPGLVGKLKSILSAIKPDLVHAGPLQDVAYLATRAGAENLLAMSWGFDLMKDIPSSWVARSRAEVTLAQAKALIVDAQCSAEAAVRLGYPAEKICKFPWGVDVEHFSPQAVIASGSEWRQQQGWQDKTVLLCLRSWEPNYGVDVLAAAFVKAVQQNPDLRLILLNSGSQSEKIGSILQEGGALNKVFLGGRVPNDSLVTYYGAADVYVSPSHVDGSSVSLMEAMASGLPSLVSDIPANKEWVFPSQNGWLFPDGDVEALTEAILNISRSDLHALGSQARKDAVLKADWRVNEQLLLTCYEQLLPGKEI